MRGCVLCACIYAFCTICGSAHVWAEDQVAPSATERAVEGVSDETGKSSLIMRAHKVVSSGVGFPAESEVILDPEFDARHIKEHSAKQELSVPVIKRTYQKPQRCTKNYTEREKVYDEPEKAEIIYDLAFIPRDLMTTEPQDLFGVETRIYPYGGRNDKASITRMELHDVPCLPYRVRKSNTTWYRHYGLDALRNYDKEPLGKGTLHPWVRKRYF